MHLVFCVKKNRMTLPDSLPPALNYSFQLATQQSKAIDREQEAAALAAAAAAEIARVEEEEAAKARAAAVEEAAAARAAAAEMLRLEQEAEAEQERQARVKVAEQVRRDVSWWARVRIVWHALVYSGVWSG